MDIHKPKPFHNWREFLKEVGIIVLGVSIALAGEQAVEKWRDRRQHDEARQAMRDELSNNLANIRRRERSIACTRQRIGDIGAMLDRADSGQNFEAPTWIGPSFSYRLRFNAEGEAGKSALFSTVEQYGYGSHYNYFHALDLEQDRERLAWARLRMLEGHSHLGPEMIQALRNALADAHFEYDRIVYLLVWTKTFGKQLGLKDLTHESQYTSDIVLRQPHCIPMNTPVAQAEHDSEVIAAPLLRDDRFKILPELQKR